MKGYHWPTVPTPLHWKLKERIDDCLTSESVSVFEMRMPYPYNVVLLKIICYAFNVGFALEGRYIDTWVIVFLFSYLWYYCLLAVVSVLTTYIPYTPRYCENRDFSIDLGERELSCEHEWTTGNKFRNDIGVFVQRWMTNINTFYFYYYYLYFILHKINIEL